MSTIIQILGSYGFAWTNDGDSAVITASNATVLALPSAIQQAAFSFASQATWFEGPKTGTIPYNGATIDFSATTSPTRTTVTVGLQTEVPSSVNHVPVRRTAPQWHPPSKVGMGGTPAAAAQVQANMATWRAVLAPLPQAIYTIVGTQGLAAIPPPPNGFSSGFSISSTLAELDEIATVTTSFLAQTPGWIAQGTALGYLQAAQSFASLEGALGNLGTLVTNLKNLSNISSFSSASWALGVLQNVVTKLVPFVGPGPLETDAALLQQAATQVQNTPIHLGPAMPTPATSATPPIHLPAAPLPSTAAPASTTPAPAAPAPATPTAFAPLRFPMLVSAPVVASPASATSPSAGPAIAVGAGAGIASLLAYLAFL